MSRVGSDIIQAFEVDTGIQELQNTERMGCHNFASTVFMPLESSSGGAILIVMAAREQCLS